jgi:hypothetical protein
MQRKIEAAWPEASLAWGYFPVPTSRLIIQDYTISQGILSPPVLADRFRRVVQPFAVGNQCDQFDGAKEFHRVRSWPAERPQFSRADEDGDIVR